MAKKKLGNVNVNTQNMRANISLARFDEQIQSAQYWLDSQDVSCTMVKVWLTN